MKMTNKSKAPSVAGLVSLPTSLPTLPVRTSTNGLDLETMDSRTSLAGRLIATGASLSCCIVWMAGRSTVSTFVERIVRRYMYAQ
jgi:hypothetical protein